MESIENKVVKAAGFYHTSMLSVDYKQTEFCYRSLKPYFRGKVGCELGPSTGYMTKMLINDFKELDIIEGAADLLEKIPEYPNLKKYHSLFEDFIPKRKYDTIIMNHVLEHIAEPVELLKKLAALLSEKGVLLVGVPNAKSFHRLAAVKMGLLSSEFELNERDKQLGHYRVYDFALLIKHASEAGLKLIEKGGVSLKFLSNAQLEQLGNDKILEAYYELGKEYPSNTAEIYIVCEKQD